VAATGAALNLVCFFLNLGAKFPRFACGAMWRVVIGQLKWTRSIGGRIPLAPQVGFMTTARNYRRTLRAAMAGDPKSEERET
jgi:hypothetical protein